MKYSFFKNQEIIRRAVGSQLPINDKFLTIRPFLDDPDLLREFMAIATSDWLRLLRDHGFFLNPPATTMRQDGCVDHVYWPASGFLARVANSAPAEVTEILALIQTDNPWILNDIISAAEVMPAEFATRLVTQIAKAVKENKGHIHFARACQLCARLSKGGHADAALNLAIDIFTPRLVQGTDDLQQEEHQYLDQLSVVAPTLVTVRPNEFIKVLLEWLRIAVLAREHGGRDMSYFWRSAIEDHPQNSGYFWGGRLVEIVRRAFEQTIGNNVFSLAEATQTLSQKIYPIFIRLQIHLINVFADHDLELARRTMMRKHFFTNLSYKHEYARLIGAHFGSLSRKDQVKWLLWVEKGPYFKMKEKERLTHKKYWQFQRLHWIKDHLEGDWKTVYEQMLKTHGEPELADLNVKSSSFSVGNDSPCTPMELKAMGAFAKVVAFIESWRPTKPIYEGPSILGLASTFGSYVAQEVGDLSRHAYEMRGSPPIFVRIFLEKMSTALRDGKDIDTLEVLRLCRWVVDEADPVSALSTTNDDDRDWQFTRDTISGLIEQLCLTKMKANAAPDARTRKDIAYILNSLTQDPAKSYLMSAGETDPRVTDFSDVAINSPRGKAIQALLVFAHWLAKQNTIKEHNEEWVTGGFSMMPEVERMLKWQIAAENASYEAWSVIGSHLWLIYKIDRTWLECNVPILFNLAQGEQSLMTACGWATWNSFLVWNNPHIEFYKLLKTQFAIAAGVANHVKLSTRSAVAQPMYRLAEHFMVLYGRGQLDQMEDTEVLHGFLRGAVAEIRTHAFEFVGRSLSIDEALPNNIIKRFMDIWEWYWPSIGKKEVVPKRDASMFGTWVVCNQFPVVWTLTQLEDFVREVGVPEPDILVMKQVAKYSGEYPTESVRILELIERADDTPSGWHISSWNVDVTTILKNAMNAGNSARDIAEAVIDRLGRRGFMNFGELLPNVDTLLNGIDLEGARSSMKTTDKKPLRVFYSYSSKDEEFKAELETQLTLLKRQGHLDTWNMRLIPPGKEWDKVIDENLKAAEIILLLVSGDFLASDYCYDVEMKFAMAQHEAKKATVIPIIIRDCDWKTAPFGKLQALPKDAKAVKTWPDRDTAWKDVAETIRKHLEELRP